MTSSSATDLRRRRALPTEPPDARYIELLFHAPPLGLRVGRLDHAVDAVIGLLPTDS